MKLDDILQTWTEDSKIDRGDLEAENLRLPTLHSKYWSLLTSERIVLKKYDSDFKILYLQKFEFLTQGSTKETNEKGWELPPCGRIIKSDVDRYLEADSQMIEIGLKISIQREKVSLLEDIIKTINGRSWILTNILNVRKFENGIA